MDEFYKSFNERTKNARFILTHYETLKEKRVFQSYFNFVSKPYKNAAKNILCRGHRQSVKVPTSNIKNNAINQNCVYVTLRRTVMTDNGLFTSTIYRDVFVYQIHVHSHSRMNTTIVIRSCYITHVTYKEIRNGYIRSDTSIVMW